MPISPLPDGTVRRLGSSLTITSPVTLLKELLENAIDSGATSIEVLVSPNTVDRIEVRDNGHGISADDFDSLGRPGYTSKLTSFDELSGLGGSSLGFRGSALASANALAQISLTTRVSTEQVASVISLANGGGIDTQRHAAAPVGTSVSVTSLFSRLPVRSQVAVKEAPRNLARMKELLLSYALSRPWIKLRFTVLNTPNMSWSYVPAPNGGLKEAAMQLFGTDFANRCVFKAFPEGLDSNRPSVFCEGLDSPNWREEGLGFEALLPSPGADLRKVAKGAYFSVDSRPISPSRGTGKKLLSAFKRRLADHFAQARSRDLPRDLFIRLNIRCPPGSYDVNVEPSKEDVLFSDEQRVLDGFEAFLSLIYSPSDPCVSPPTARNSDSPALVNSRAPSPRPPPQVAGPTWRVDMSSGLDELSDDGGETTPLVRPQITAEVMLSAPDDEIGETSMEQSSKGGLNPWTIAKLTGAPRRLEPTVREPEPSQLCSPTRNPVFADSVSVGPDGTLPTRPERSLTHHLRSQPGYQSSTGSFDNPAFSARPLQDVFRPGFRQPAVSSIGSITRQDRPRRNRRLPSPPTSSPKERVYDMSLPRGRPHKPARKESGRILQSRISFREHSERQQSPHCDKSELDQQPTEPGNRRRYMRTSPASHLTRREDTDGTSFDTLNLDIRHEKRQVRSPPPHQSTLHAQSAPDLSRTVTEASPKGDLGEVHADILLATEDPRMRLIRQQRFIRQQKKPRRLKTEHLPLETIPSNFQTSALLLTMPADAYHLAQLLTGLSRFDTYLVDGNLRGAFTGGGSPEHYAALIEPLLRRVDHEPTVII